MDKIVLDTNCLLQIIPRKAKYRLVWDLIKNGQITLCVTTEILYEYEEILTSQYSKEVASSVVKAIANFSGTQKINVHYRWGLIKVDTDDNKFVDCAVNCSAKAIVSDDRHFRVLEKVDFPKVVVKTLTEYYESL